MKPLANTLFSLFLVISSVSVNADQPSAGQANLSDENNAQVIIYRPKQSSLVSAINYRLYIDDKGIGKMKVNSHQTYYLSPGEHKIVTNDKAHSKITVNLKPNQVTVIRAAVRKSHSLNFTVIEAKQAIEESPAILSRINKQDRHLSQL